MFFAKEPPYVIELASLSILFSIATLVALLFRGNPTTSSFVPEACLLLAHAPLFVLACLALIPRRAASRHGY